MQLLCVPPLLAIREMDPDRLIILDGLNYGNVPMPDLGDLAEDTVAQSCRAYIPGGVTHYRALWVDRKARFSLNLLVAGRICCRRNLGS